MLILARKQGQSIHIGDDITITVAEFHGYPGEQPSIRLAIEAPKSVPVHREEVYRKIHAADAAHKRVTSDLDKALAIVTPPLGFAGVNNDATDALLQRDGQI